MCKNIDSILNTMYNKIVIYNDVTKQAFCLWCLKRGFVKMLKRYLKLIALFTAAVLLFPCLPISVFAESEHTSHCVCSGNAAGAQGHTCNEDVTWVAIASEDDLLTYLKDYAEETSVYLYLTSSFTTTQAYTVGKNEHLNLCLNGNTITAGDGLAVFTVGDSAFTDASYNAVLTISDCSYGETGAITGGKVSSGTKVGTNISVYTGGSLYLYGGNVTNGKNSSSSNGGNIFVSGGTFNMYGGTVSDGKVTGSTKGGGNLYVEKNGKNGGVFNMYGGVIKNGQALYGGNIYFANNANVHIYAGTVKDGARYSGAADTTPCLGGNICICNGSDVVIENALIEGGNAMSPKVTGYGGNIYIFTDASFNPCTLTMNNTIVKDGKANSAGNFYVKDRTNVTLNGCTISGGLATSVVNKAGSTVGGFGGNIFITTGKTGDAGTVTVNDTVIKDGFADGQTGGNVCISTDGVFTMNSGTVSGGKSKTGGQGGLAVYMGSALYGNGPIYNLFGGTIKDNQTGVNITAGELHLKGDLTIKDNGSNILLADGVEITLDGELTGGENSVGVTYDINNEFAAGDIDASSAFFSDYGTDTSKIIYDGGKKVHRVINSDFTDFNTLTKSEAANKKIDVYIIAGQSNAIGSTTFASAKEGERDNNVYPHVHYWCYRENTDGTVTQNKTDYRAVREGFGSQSNHIGPELGMARILEEEYKNSDREAVIFKFAAGGTSILDHATGVNGNDLKWYMKVTNTKKFGTWWCGEENAEALSFDSSDYRATGFLYRGFLNTFDTFYNDLIEKGFTQDNINLVSLSWLQGETDRLKPTEYKPQFNELMTKFRNFFYEHTGNEKDKTLPVIMNEISSSFAAADESNINTNVAFIKAQREMVDTVQNYSVLPTAGLMQNRIEDGVSVQCGTDNAHYKYADQLLIGSMLAKASLGEELPRHEHCDCVDGADIGDHTEHSNNIYEPVITADELTAYATKTGEHYVYLTADIYLTDRMNINTDNVKLHICLNGHTVFTNDKAAFGLNTGTKDLSASLTVTDCSRDEWGAIVKRDTETAPKFSGGLIHVGPKCTFNLYKGTVSGGKVIKGSASYEERGGNIALNSTAALGGGSMNMYGGTIKDGNAAYLGGNIYIRDKCTFNMYGGVVKDGIVTGESTSGNCNGYNICNEGTANFIGGTVSGKGTGSGGAASVTASADKSVINLSGDAVLGGIVQVIPAGSKMNITGGSVNILYAHNGEAVVNGGTIKEIRVKAANGKVTVNGGKVQLLPEKGDMAGKLTANGGMYVSDPTVYLGEGCIGVKPINKQVDGITYLFEIIGQHIIGDMDENKIVNDKDALYLLFHAYFADEYPIYQNGDLNKDGIVDTKDAVKLLYYVYFPALFPIEN